MNDVLTDQARASPSTFAATHTLCAGDSVHVMVNKWKGGRLSDLSLHSIPTQRIYSVTRNAAFHPVLRFQCIRSLHASLNPRSIGTWMLVIPFLVNTSVTSDLTRLNKIAIQGTPQMAVDKEAISMGSRFHI